MKTRPANNRCDFRLHDAAIVQAHHMESNPCKETSTRRAQQSYLVTLESVVLYCQGSNPSDTTVTETTFAVRRLHPIDRITSHDMKLVATGTELMKPHINAQS